MPQNFQRHYIFKQQSKSIKTGAVLGGSFTLGWSFPKGRNRTRMCTRVGGGHPLGGPRKKVQDLRPFLRSSCQWRLCWGTSARTLPGSCRSPEQTPLSFSPSPLHPPRLPSAAGETPGKDNEHPDKTAPRREGDRPGSIPRLRDTPWSPGTLATRTAPMPPASHQAPPMPLPGT